MSTSERSFRVWDCERMLRVRCPQAWEKLDPGPEADVRRCRECDQDVYLCRTPADFVSHGEHGRCCGLIPDDMSPHLGMGLGQSSPEEVLMLKILADRGLASWDEGLLPLAAPSSEQIEEIRATVSKCYSPEHLAILRLAAHNGGLPCPRCGIDIARDDLMVRLFLATSFDVLLAGNGSRLELPSELASRPCQRLPVDLAVKDGRSGRRVSPAQPRPRPGVSCGLRHGAWPASESFASLARHSATLSVFPQAS